MTTSPVRLEDQMVLTGNDKRKASCKAIGGAKKRGGHAHESVFNKQFGDTDVITYKPEADCVISPENLAGKALIAQLTEKFGALRNYNISLKSSKSIQFVLGNIPEISTAADGPAKLAAIAQRSLWEKYLAKSMSAAPASLLCYRKGNTWRFFNMENVLDHIVTYGKWRILGTGRIKGDFSDNSKKGSRQYLTYEYRGTHGSHFLGANGGKGAQWIELLTASLPHLNIPVS